MSIDPDLHKKLEWVKASRKIREWALSPEWRALRGVAWIGLALEHHVPDPYSEKTKIRMQRLIKDTRNNFKIRQKK